MYIFYELKPMEEERTTEYNIFQCVSILSGNHPITSEEQEPGMCKENKFWASTLSFFKALLRVQLHVRPCGGQKVHATGIDCRTPVPKC